MVPLKDNAPRIAGTVITLTVLGCIVFLLRIYVRVSNRAWGLDDWCTTVAVVPWVGLSAVCIGGAFHGVGVDESRLTSDETKVALMWFWLFEIFWCMAVIPVKLSISCMIGRIAVGRRPYIISLWAISILLTVITLLGLFYIVFRCNPVSYAWDTTIPGGKCQPVNILAYIYYCTTAVNIAIDWLCALLPIPLLWNVPLDFKTKLSVGVLLSLGVLASLAACVRQRYTTALTGAEDVMYSFGNLVIWGYAEVGIGFFVGSLSTLRPLFSSRPRQALAPSWKAEDQQLEALPRTSRGDEAMPVDAREMYRRSNETERYSIPEWPLVSKELVG